MRHFIIDTDTGGDDALALMMMLMDSGVQVEAVTTVFGNVDLEQATQNALATLELVGGELPPVYKGASRPLLREPLTTVHAHGSDGMGDCGLVHPHIAPREGHAVDVICQLAKRFPGELEILMIGPATNVALALMKEPETMQGVKHIYSMGTGGYSLGMETAVAEFNVLVDAEAYDAVLRSEIPLTIAGFDLCLGETAFSAQDIDLLNQSGSALASFVVQSNRVLLEMATARLGYPTVPLPDALAAAAALWPDTVVEAEDRFCYTCYREEATYGQVIPFLPNTIATAGGYQNQPANARLIKRMDAALFKERVLKMLLP